MIKIFIDNKSAIAFAKNQVFHERTWHIDTRFHSIREQVKDIEIELIFDKPQDNVGDIFTKPLKYVTFSLLRKGPRVANSS